MSLVGLAAPHAARRLLGEDARRLLPAAVCGAGLLLGADILARTVELGWLGLAAGRGDASQALDGTGLFVGAVTALLGAPVLLALLLRPGARP